MADRMTAGRKSLLSAAKPCENCGHVERVTFVCPACGRSFKARSERSYRIFCSRECAR